MRGLTSTIVLVVVLAGLGAYIYFVESKRPASGIEAKDKVFSVEADKIEEIRIKAESDASVMRKADGVWKLTEPVQADADQNEISSITSNIASLEVNRVIDENASDLAQYGLAQPKIVISFKGANNAAGELHLGEKTPTQSDVYAVRPGEKKVFLVSAYQESTFNKKPFDLRDKKILAFDRDKVDLLEVSQGGGPPVQLARAGSEWVVKQPVQARGDYSAIEGLLTRLASGTMTKIVEPEASAPSLPKYGLDKPAVLVNIGAGSTRAALAIGKEEEGAVYARDLSRPMLFTVDPSLLTDLKKTVDDYRDKDVFEFRPFNLDRLRITRGTDTYEFQKVAGSGENPTDKWQRVNPGGAAATDVERAKIDDLLSKISNLRAQSFATAAASLTEPVVVAASYDGGKFERVRLGMAGTDVIAIREGEPGAARLDSTEYKSMLTALDDAVK